MAEKFICTMSDEELEYAYLGEGRTLEQMCDVIGVKSPITVRKILNERGINTNKNNLLSMKSRKGMSNKEFKDYLIEEYSSGKSMGTIGEQLGVTPSCIRKYFLKYGIERRDRCEHFKGKSFNNPHWRGGRKEAKDGYIHVYCPDHPKAIDGKYVYEHHLVMEERIGRYLRSGEVVHHIDGNKHNNNIDNLLLMTSSDHTKLHAILRNCKRLMDACDEERKQQCLI